MAGGNLVFPESSERYQFNFSGGRLSGAGTLGGALEVSGSAEIAPGSPIGTLIISNAVEPGNLMFGMGNTPKDTNSVMSIDIAGSAPGTG